MPLDLVARLAPVLLIGVIAMVLFMPIFLWVLPLAVSIGLGHGRKPMILRFARGAYFIPPALMGIACMFLALFDSSPDVVLIDGIVMIVAAIWGIRNALHIDHLSVGFRANTAD